MITLTAVIVTKYPNGDDDKLPAAIGLVVLACVASGLVSGSRSPASGSRRSSRRSASTRCLTGAVYQITSGAATSSATPGLARFALAKTAGIPNTVIIAVRHGRAASPR